MRAAVPGLSGNSTTRKDEGMSDDLYAFVVESFYDRDDPETVPDLASVRAVADGMTFGGPADISVTAKFRDGGDRVVRRECYARLRDDRERAEAWVRNRQAFIEKHNGAGFARAMGSFTADPDASFEDQVGQFMANDWEWLEAPLAPDYKPNPTTPPAPAPLSDHIEGTNP